MKILLADIGNPKSLSSILTLNSTKKLIKSVCSDAKIIVHSSDIKNKDLGVTRFWNQSLFSYLVMSNVNPLIRFLRFLRFLKHIGSGKYPPLPGKDLFLSICHDYWQSDVVIFTSGSGLSSKNLVKDSLRLVVNNLIVKYALLGGRKVVIMPVGFGPFKYSFQAALAKSGIKNTSQVFARNNNSYQLLRSELVKVDKSYDPILFLNLNLNSQKPKKDLRIGVTFRNWDNRDFENFEIELAEAFYPLSKVRKLSFYPILIDNRHDKNALERSFYRIFEKYALSCGIKVRKAKVFSKLSDVSHIIQKLDFFISLRTNSTLLAVTSGIPFAAFSKHEKVKLLLKEMKLEKYFVKESELNSPEGKKNLINMVTDSGKQKAVLKSIKVKIMKEDRRKFVKILAESISLDSQRQRQLTEYSQARLSTLAKLA